MSKTLIYIADDEEDLRHILQEFLEMEGHTVETAPDGESLLALVDDRRPDLVLLDIAMPGPSGWEVKRKLDEAHASEIPVIAITAHGGQSVETSARKALGFVDLLQKPFRMREFFDRTNTALIPKTGP